MKMTVKEFVKLDLTRLMQVNGGTSACGNYTQTQPATPPSGGNETNNVLSNNGGDTGGSENTNDTTSSYSPDYSGVSTTGTSTGTCGGSGGQTLPPENPPKTNDKPNNDTTNNNNNNGGGGTSVGGCSSINGGNGNGNGDELKGKDGKEDDDVANDLPTEPSTPPEQPSSPNTPNESTTNPNDSSKNSTEYHPEDWIVESEKGISFPLGDGNITGDDGEIKYQMTSNYGMRDPIPEAGINKENYHNGIDFAAKEGERINSVADGCITTIGYSEALGNYVVVTHENGTSTRYAHCSDINVSVGDIVDGGQMIAAVGQTGSATGPHLHLSFDANGNGSFNDEEIDDPNLLFNF